MPKQAIEDKGYGLRILIAESEPDIQQLYRSFLNGWSSVDIVNTDKECIERLSATIEKGKEIRHPVYHDMIIIDSHLAGVNGAIRCIKKIQHQEQQLLEAAIQDQQCLIVTSTTPVRFREEAKQAGIRLDGIRILEKPFSFVQFLSLIPSSMPRTSKIGLHDHVLAVYDTPEEEFSEAVRFLNDAKSRGESALFIVRAEEYDIDVLKTRLRGRIAGDIDLLLSDGSLIIMRNEDWYFSDADVNKHKIIEQWAELVDRCVTRGKKGLRAFCMMDCFFEHDFAEQVVDYEHTLPVNFTMPFVPICAYRKQDIDMLSEDQKRSLVTCHSHVWTNISLKPT